ncbi:MAG TPA: DEAD/DEAH box helicase [Candidatus Brocadiia bacterium]|nr:DEAD/DEAH box helicase [Candidatus Brocadiia bacterium]
MSVPRRPGPDGSPLGEVRPGKQRPTIIREALFCERCSVVESNQNGSNFSQYGLSENILRDVAELGYQNPTPIQAECIPPALSGKDIIGLAQTGTGKTAAFGLPIIQKTAGKVEMSALILAPTRELAQQTAEALQNLGRSSGIAVALVVGGIPIKEDYKALRSWPNVLVATPGRLIDHIRSRTVVLKDIKILAVDEADRMYDMGFMPQIVEIINALPKERQTLMFTATMPDEVEKLVRRHMRSPVRIKVGRTTPVASATQNLYDVQESGKTPLLMSLLRESKGRVLIFARTKRKVDRLARALSRRFQVGRLHGDREQSQREKTMAGFRDGTNRVLVATDIASRGLDVADIEHVINYDFPGSCEDYIHRVGRTARVGACGMATTFVTREDRRALAELEKMISAKLPLVRSDIPVEEADRVPSSARASGHSRGTGTARPSSGNSRRGGRPRARSGRQNAPERREGGENHSPDHNRNRRTGPRRDSRTHGR